MPRIIHPVAGALAFLLIGTFWLSTVASELFATRATIAIVKTAIPWGFLLLVPALAATAGTGLLLAKGQRGGAVGAKLKRMPFIAANGLLVLIPSAFFLASKARAGDFGNAFYLVQALELVAGATNLTLLGLNMRDGLQLTRWRRANFLQLGSERSLVLTRAEEVAVGTMAFHFSKPEGFRFIAGQAGYLSLFGSPKSDSGGDVRVFSIASAPQEPELLVATRLRDTSFKRALKASSPGAQLAFEGPFGDLTLHDDGARPGVFLAGGIGITPFRSIIVDATLRKLPHQLFLFYSNPSPSTAAFLPELAELERKNPNFKLVATMTGTGDAEANWKGERGYITLEMIGRHVRDLSAPIYYLAGPPSMVTAMEKLIQKAGVSRRDIHAEDFSGY